MWCDFLLVYILCLLIIPTTSVNMCTNGTNSSKDVTLYLSNGTGVSGCTCSVKLHNSDIIGHVKPTITFGVQQFSGCKYRLVISYKNQSPSFSCSNNNTIFYYINKTDEIKLYLEPTYPPQDDTTTFQVNIKSSVTSIGGALIRLDCLSANIDQNKPTSDKSLTTEVRTSTPQSSTTKIEKTTQKTTTTIISTKPKTSFIFVTMSTSRSTHETTPRSTQDSTQISTQISTSISESSSGSMTVSDAQITKESTIIDKQIEDKDKCELVDDDIVIAGVIGGIIGGVIVGVIVSIIFCVLKYRKRNSTSGIYSTPQQQQPESLYTDLQLSYQNIGNNSSLTTS